jgi:hypothetical protein
MLIVFISREIKQQSIIDEESRVFNFETRPKARENKKYEIEDLTFSRYSIFKSTIYTEYIFENENETPENGLTVRNISSFYNKFFIFCGKLPSDPPNFIKLLNKPIVSILLLKMD